MGPCPCLYATVTSMDTVRTARLVLEFLLNGHPIIVLHCIRLCSERANPHCVLEVIRFPQNRT
jgi:hypothetical protein